MPADDFSSEEVYDDAEVVVISVDFHICKIADPYEIGSLLSKSLLQMIYAGTIISFCARPLRFNSGHLRQVHGVHQAVHSSDTDVDAIITFKDTANLISADAFIKVSIYLKDDDLDLLIFTCPCSRFRMEMLVVSAPVDSQNLAESFYIVLVTKLMNGV